MSTTVRDNSDRQRYEIEVDGQVAGFADYVRTPGRITFPHTEVGQAYGGRGLARELVRFALDEAKSQGEQVVPLCSYVRKVIADDPDRYLALVPEAERAHLGL